jgi:hypothetical protein
MLNDVREPSINSKPESLKGGTGFACFVCCCGTCAGFME